MPERKFQVTPFGGDLRLQHYLQTQFDRFWEMFQGGDKVLIIPVSDVEPARPRDGMLVYADGTNWDPGAGEGIYAYFGSTWNSLHS